jgi:hypothetical protein
VVSEESRREPKQMQRQLLQLRRYTEKEMNEGSATARANNQHQHSPLEVSKLTGCWRAWLRVISCDTSNTSASALHTATDDATRVAAEFDMLSKDKFKKEKEKENKSVKERVKGKESGEKTRKRVSAGHSLLPFALQKGFLVVRMQRKT